MTGKIIGALAIGAATFFTHAASATAYLGCESCSSAQMMQTAQNAGAGRFIVGDIVNKKASAFVVSVVQHVGAKPTLEVSSDVLSPLESKGFDGLMAFYDDAPVGYQKVYDLVIDASSAHPTTASSWLQTMPFTLRGGGHVTYPSGNPSAFDLIDESPAQSKFLTWIGSMPQFGIAKAMNDLTSAISVVQVFDMTHRPGLAYVVTFADGSAMSAHVDIAQRPAQLTVNATSAIDSHGNTIPANQVAITGGGRKVYDYRGSGSAGDAPRMRTRLGYFGVTAPASVAFACVQLEASGTHCTSYAGR